jgi:hypothetical protein
MKLEMSGVFHEVVEHLKLVVVRPYFFLVFALLNKLDHPAFHSLDDILLALHPTFNPADLIIKKVKLMQLQVRVLALFKLPLGFFAHAFTLVLFLFLLLVLFRSFVSVVTTLFIILSLLLQQLLDHILKRGRPVFVFDLVPSLHNCIFVPDPELILPQLLSVILIIVVMEYIV